MSAEKLRLYNEWASRVHAAGVELAEYPCPHCDFLLHTHMPEGERVYDSLTSCPNCDLMHFKAVKSDGSVFVRFETDGRIREVNHAETH